MEYKIVIDQALVDEYCEAYFKLHPRAHKKPIERPTQPSLNVLLTTPRIQQNAIKQRWKEFGMYVVKKYGFENLMLEKFEMDISVYMKTKRRFDLDNHCNCKLLLDSFTASGFIVDDDSLHLTKMVLSGGYDKDNPRTEITLRTIEEEQEEGK